MALTKLLGRTSALMFRPQTAVTKIHLTTSAVVLSKDSNKLPNEELEEYGYPDTLDMSCGMERKQLLARIAGVEDPFSLSAIDRGNIGTKLEPIRVPSALQSRIIACRCSDDSHTLIYMWLHQNEELLENISIQDHMNLKIELPVVAQRVTRTRSSGSTSTDSTSSKPK